MQKFLGLLLINMILFIMLLLLRGLYTTWNFIFLKHESCYDFIRVGFLFNFACVIFKIAQYNVTSHM